MEPPRRRSSWVLPHTAGGRSRSGESAAYASRHRHPKHISTQSVLYNLAPGPGRQGETPGGVLTSRGHVPPPQVGLARREVTGRRPDRLGRGQGRSVQAYLRMRERKREAKSACETGGT